MPRLSIRRLSILVLGGVAALVGAASAEAQSLRTSRYHGCRSWDGGCAAAQSGSTLPRYERWEDGAPARSFGGPTGNNFPMRSFSGVYDFGR